MGTVLRQGLCYHISVVFWRSSSCLEKTLLAWCGVLGFVAADPIAFFTALPREAGIACGANCMYIGWASLSELRFRQSLRSTLFGLKGIAPQ